MGVIVTSSYAKSGSTIPGNIAHIIVVKTGPGYGPNPGHRRQRQGHRPGLLGPERNMEF